MRRNKRRLGLLACFLFLLTACVPTGIEPEEMYKPEVRQEEAVQSTQEGESEQEVSEPQQNETSGRYVYPEYSERPYVVINDNIPAFTAEEKKSNECFESYSELDELGRCGVALACVGLETMPTEDRGAIGSVKPTGWHTVKYEGIDGNYLYNRCHLIGFQLAGENANERNLITGTRYLNAYTMLPFENKVANYIEETQHHVLYRVTPVFEGDNLLASGVQMEAYSIEDEGEGLSFNVFCYNIQPGILIDYASGESSLDPTTTIEEATLKVDGSRADNKEDAAFIVNKKSGVLHHATCENLPKEYNRLYFDVQEDAEEKSAELSESGQTKYCKNETW